MFSVLVERANRWMSQYTDFELVNCETVDKKVKLVQDIYNANMALWRRHLPRHVSCYAC